jgi:hypothetical protein
VPQIKITVDPIALAFWEAQLSARGETKSHWLNLILRTWAQTGKEPRAYITGPDWGEGIAVAATLAAKKQAPKTASSPQDAVRDAFLERFDEAEAAYDAAYAAYNRAKQGPRLPDAAFARIRQEYLDARDKADELGVLSSHRQDAYHDYCERQARKAAE